jgi:ribosome-binding factor A
MQHKKSQKQLQVGENIKRIIAEIFLNNEIIKDNTIYIVVKKADISPDMKNAKIFLSIIGNCDESLIIKSLNESSTFFEKKLFYKLHLKNSPKIKFMIDKNYDNFSKIEKMIDESSSS